MVYSKLESNVYYNETKELEKCDYNNESQLYEYNILNLFLIISVGIKNKAYISSGIIYFPVYLISNNKFISKIGILEIDINTENKIYDVDGDIDLEKCREPLLFGFATHEYLKTYAINEGEYSDSDDDVDGDNWIIEYMGITNYSIHDNSGGGDCLFIAVSDAFECINKIITVAEMRKEISDSTTKEVYNNYKELYNSFVKSIKDNSERMNEIKLNNEILKKKIKDEEDRGKKRKILKDGKECLEMFNIYKSQNELTLNMLNEYVFMSDVNSLDEFKNVILKQTFWADTWAISTLEEKLNIKIVVLSSENYMNGDVDNVLLCKDYHNSEIKEDRNINPAYYIIVDYNGYHYKLITYNGLSIFDFEHLPNEIRELIINKCLENMGGTYSLIPDFAALIGNKIIKSETGSENKNGNELYDKREGTIFMIYPRSSSVHEPGKGAGETIRGEKIVEYVDLREIHNWRRLLSSYYEAPFTLDDLKWNTIEHYIQGSKFKKTDPDYYKSFSLNMGTEYSKDPFIAKNEIMKIIKECDIDYDYKCVLEEAYEQRMREDKFSRKVLLLTKKAKLMHYQYRKQPTEMTALMKVRNKIK